MSDETQFYVKGTVILRVIADSEDDAIAEARRALESSITAPRVVSLAINTSFHVLRARALTTDSIEDLLGSGS
jgi:hypothetical protein